MSARHASELAGILEADPNLSSRFVVPEWITDNARVAADGGGRRLGPRGARAAINNITGVQKLFAEQRFLFVAVAAAGSSVEEPPILLEAFGRALAWFVWVHRPVYNEDERHSCE